MEPPSLFEFQQEIRFNESAFISFTRGRRNSRTPRERTGAAREWKKRGKFKSDTRDDVASTERLLDKRGGTQADRGMERGNLGAT